MRILHILDHSLPLQSGYVFRTLGIFRGQAAMGWHPVGLTTPRHSAPSDADCETFRGWRFHRTPAPRLRGPAIGDLAQMRATYQRILAVAAEEKPEILHAHSPALNAWPAVMAGRRLGLPVVYEIRAFWEDAAVDAGTTRAGSLRYRLTRWLETTAARRVDGLAAICEGLRADLGARAGLNADEIGLSPNAVEVERHPPIAARDGALSAELGIGDAPVVGFIGSFYAYEGLDLLIAAFPAMGAAIPGLRLILVGGGPEEARLKAMAAPYGDAVLFTGRVPNEQVRRYYSLIDLLCYPRRSSRLTETVTPLKPLEAMAMTRPFLASDIGGHRELIKDGVTGLLCPPDDAAALAAAAIAALTAPDSQRAAMLEAGRRYVETERSWESVAQRYKDIYARARAKHALR